MAEVDYQERTHRESTEAGTFEITSTIKIETKEVLTNDEIERRKNLPKFGDCKDLAKGQIEGFITLDEKEQFLQGQHQARGEESVAKYIMQRGRKEKLDALSRKQKAISGVEEEKSKAKEIMPMREEFSLKVSNIPGDIEERDLLELFSQAGRVRRVFIPRSRDTGNQRDFAFVHFDTKEEAMKGIKVGNGITMGHHILSCELAERRGQRRPPVRGRGK